MINKNLIEALLFSTPEPLTQVKLNQIIPDENVDLREIVDEINLEYEKFGKALFIEEIGGGFQILTKPEYHYYIQRLYNKSKKFQLSRPAMEALSIIAYRQPISKVEVESIRGVNCDSVVKSLMERELITIKGREEGLGRALLYGTTQHFLEAFGLNRISDLPKLKELSELMDDGQTPTEVLDASE
ncbi:MAG: SMC-Scp complex subunit ScpB [Candidatus Marinimicrobia bacterium]|nr:SMC-Scp complex subunit ScpB [Candidatus Neomarinimicrobiota bacterium]MBL7022629.1 SMC-Scp complex subunit ScpB [Candidatus Neomarinimicrobiota bacterium]MBL7109628.1 SMC-Scp complex subunit ScpB [Candidatus Neomarinimicrobiota bacterium]